MSFEAFCEIYTKDLKARLKESTWQTKENIIQKKLLPYFGKRKICEITTKDVIAWQNEMLAYRDKNHKPYSQTYLKTLHNQLSAIFNHAVRFYDLHANPAAKAGNMGNEERKEMLFWTKEEYLKFSEEMMDKPVSYYAFEMLYWCGIREGELLALTPADFDFEAGTVKISDRVMRSLIEGYTREAGVRTLERTIAKVIRKAAVTMLDEGETDVTVTEKVLHQYLGAPRFTRELPEKEPRVGIVNGLAYTTVGGETLEVECLTMPGKGGLRLTGQLGDVMKESAEAAFSYVRAHCADLGLADDFYKDVDIHIHVPEGAVPKDGPSAGVTMATALVSVLTGIPVRNDVAMTGEITLRGRVLPIGGLKEKTLAAYRAGITTLIIPKENQKDLEEIPPHVLSQFKIVCVEQIEQVLENALVRMPEKRKS